MSSFAMRSWMSDTLMWKKNIVGKLSLFYSNVKEKRKK